LGRPDLLLHFALLAAAFLAGCGGRALPIELHSSRAKVHGKQLRYEPEPRKDTLGYWTDAADWAEWPLRIDRPGVYHVIVLQGCGAGQGGSQVVVSLAGQTLPFTVKDTGHFQNFVERDIGQVRIDRAGDYTLAVRPLKKAAAAVMDLRSVTLRPD
jgi:arylsulfatase A